MRTQSENPKRGNSSGFLLGFYHYKVIYFVFAFGNGSKKYFGGTSSILQILKNNSKEKCWFRLMLLMRLK